MRTTLRLACLTWVAAIGLVGCGSDAHDHIHGIGGHTHGHAHVAPHGGTLIVLGEESAHLEWVMDAASGKVDLYVLDGEAINGLPVPQESLRFAIEGVPELTSVELQAVASSLSGETVGNSSRFQGEIAGLKGAEQFKATLEAITVRGVDFRGVSFPYPEGNEGH